MGKTKTKSRSVGDSPKPPITIRSTNVKILDDNIAKLEKAIQAGDVSANPSGTAEETLLSTIGIDGKKYELGPSAENTSYDNTDSGLTATDTQGAIDEVVTLIPEVVTPTLTTPVNITLSQSITPGSEISLGAAATIDPSVAGKTILALILRDVSDGNTHSLYFNSNGCYDRCGLEKASYSVDVSFLII